jgi:predicted nuclease of predicted toxin-antitoxin system
VKLYLDDDAAEGLLAKLLRKAGHDVALPSEIGMAGAPDSAHLARAIRDGRICVTKNYDDYWLLHALIMQAKGTHPGIAVIRQDNDPTRDLTPKGIVAAIRKLESAGRSDCK